ncbi:MAG: AsnC family transcriptional regulator, partial [Desulfobacterales bacterium]
MNNPANAVIDDIDRAVLNRIQSDFPLTPRPYHTIGQELEISEDDV